MDRKTVMRKAARIIEKAEGVSTQKAKEAVWNLTDSLINPTTPEKEHLSRVPLVRYITFEKNGCFGFCGSKYPKGGPPTIQQSQTMARYGTVGVGMNKFNPNIALIGVMYWSYMKPSNLHFQLSARYKVPVIFLHQGEGHRNRTKRAPVWEIYGEHHAK